MPPPQKKTLKVLQKTDREGWIRLKWRLTEACGTGRKLRSLGGGTSKWSWEQDGMLEIRSLYRTVCCWPAPIDVMLLFLSQQWTAKRSSFGWAWTLQGHLWSLASQLGPFHFHSRLAALQLPLRASGTFSISQSTRWSISFGSCFFLFFSGRLGGPLGSLMPNRSRKAWGGRKDKDKGQDMGLVPWGLWAGTVSSVVSNGIWGSVTNTSWGKQCLTCLQGKYSELNTQKGLGGAFPEVIRL